MVSGRDPDSGSRCDYHLDDGLRKADSAPPCGWASRRPQRPQPNKTFPACLPPRAGMLAPPTCRQVYATCSPGSQALGIGLNCTPLQPWVSGLWMADRGTSEPLRSHEPVSRNESVYHLPSNYHLSPSASPSIRPSTHPSIRPSVLLSIYLSATCHHISVILMVGFSGKPSPTSRSR